MAYACQATFELIPLSSPGIWPEMLYLLPEGLNYGRLLLLFIHPYSS